MDSDYTFRNAPVNLATPIGVTIGGLGLTATTLGALPVGTGTGYTLLPPGTAGQFLQSQGATLPAYRTGYILGSIQTFTAVGATVTTWTKPAGCRAVMVEVQAPGGGSGGCPATAAGQAAEAGGGGGGGYGRRWVVGPGTTETVTIGGPGAAGAAGANNGAAGGTMSFGTWVIALGGSGGAAGTASSGNTSADGGAGGTCSGGDVNVSGGDGGNGRMNTAFRNMTGFGGNSFFGGLKRQPLATTVSVGQAGNNYGGGAAGSNSSASQAATAGATGGIGLIVVYEHY